MSLMDALGQLWTGPLGVVGDQRALSQQEMVKQYAQHLYMFSNAKPDSTYYQLLAQYKRDVWVPTGWQYWFEIGDELH